MGLGITVTMEDHCIGASIRSQSSMPLMNQRNTPRTTADESIAPNNRNTDETEAHLQFLSQHLNASSSSNPICIARCDVERVCRRAPLNPTSHPAHEAGQSMPDLAQARQNPSDLAMQDRAPSDPATQDRPPPTLPMQDRDPPIN